MGNVIKWDKKEWMCMEESFNQNERLKQIVNPHLNKCDPQRKAVGSWLGVARIKDQLVQTLRNGTKPLGFSNWDSSPKKTHSCGIFYANGFWDSRNENTCPRLRYCPVCSFSSVPKLTMRGLCEETLVNYYWYLTTTEKFGIAYDGYKGGLQ